MRSIRIVGAVALTAALTGCDRGVVPSRELVGPDFVASVAQAPVEQPFLLVFDDVNPCTGEPITLTFEGTRRVQVFDDHRVVHISGTVTTSDGYSGTFNRQLVFHGNDVVTRRFFDMEVGPEHERVLFTSNLHVTVVDGEVKAEVQNPQLRCVGKPL